MIDGGSTTFPPVEFLKDRELRIITNSFAIAAHSFRVLAVPSSSTAGWSAWTSAARCPLTTAPRAFSWEHSESVRLEQRFASGRNQARP